MKKIFLPILISAIILCVACENRRGDTSQNVVALPILEAESLPAAVKHESSGKVEGTLYFNQDYLDRVIAGEIGENETAGLIFDETKERSLRVIHIYRSLVLRSARSGENLLSLLYMRYGNFNVMLILKKIDGVEYVLDYVLIEKQNPDSHLAGIDFIEINGVEFDTGVTLVANSSLIPTGYTDDISAVFFVNMETLSIEHLEVSEPIRLWSEH